MFDVILDYKNGDTKVVASYSLFVEAEQHRIDAERYLETNDMVERVYVLERTRNCYED